MVLVGFLKGEGDAKISSFPCPLGNLLEKLAVALSVVRDDVRTVDDKLKLELSTSDVVVPDTDILAGVRASQVKQSQSRSRQVRLVTIDCDAGR